MFQYLSFWWERIFSRLRMASVARRAVPTAATMEDGPRCTSPIIKTSVRRVSPLWSTSGQPFLSSGTPIAFRASVSCCSPMAVIRLSTSSVTVSLVSTGRRRPFSSGSPSDITRKVKVPSASKRSGLFRKRNSTPSCNASSYSSRHAGISCSERR